MMDINEISRILPQKYPFIMLDEVLSFEGGNRLVALKNVTINEEFLKGQEKPVFPGTLIIEAMAQTAILLNFYIDDQEKNQKVKYSLGSVKAQFSRPVFPGDQLRLEAVLLKKTAKGMCVAVVGFVFEERVAEAELICMAG